MALRLCFDAAPPPSFVVRRGEVVHEAGVGGVGGAAGGDGLEALRREWRSEPRSRSVLASLQPPALRAGLPLRSHAGAALLGPAPAGPAAAAAAYLGAARYVAGSRIDTTLFQPIALRPLRGKER